MGNISYSGARHSTTARQFPAVSWDRECNLLRDVEKIVGRSVTMDMLTIAEVARRRLTADVRFPTNREAVQRMRQAVAAATELRNYLNGPTYPKDSIIRTATDNRSRPTQKISVWEWAAESPADTSAPPCGGLVSELEKFLKWAETAAAKDIQGKSHIKVDVDHAGSPRRAVCSDCAEMLLSAGKCLHSSADGNLAKLTSIAWELTTGEHKKCAHVAASVAKQHRAASCKVGK